MALPGFNPAGDLPPGVHQATLAEIVARFGAGTAERERHTAHLVEICDEPARELLEHHRATSKFQASIFWIRPAMLLLESLDDFIAYWQIKRDQTRRGIIEVRA